MFALRLRYDRPSKLLGNDRRLQYKVHMRTTTFFALAALFFSLGCRSSQSPEATTIVYEARPNDEGDKPVKGDDLDLVPACQAPQYVVSLEAESVFKRAEEFYLTNFLPFKIRKSPTTNEQVKEAFIELIELSNQARQNYLEVEKYGATRWAIPAQVRVGDVLHSQAQKIMDQPVPPEIVKLIAKYPNMKILGQYRETLEALVLQLLKQARSRWEESVTAGETQCIDNDWTRLARDRLAVNKEPAAPRP